MSFLQKIQRLDDLAQRGPEYFTSISFPTDKSDGAVLIARFLSKAKGSAWLPFCSLLISKHFNNQAPATTASVHRYYLRFLKTCTDRPALVSAELARHLPNEDVSWCLWLQVYLELPMHTRGSFLLSGFIKAWSTISGDLVRQEVQDVIIDLLCRGCPDETTDFLQTILAFDPQEEKAVREHSVDVGLFKLPEPSPRFSTHEYQVLLESLAEKIPPDSCTLALTVLTSILRSAIELSIPDEEKGQRNGEDGSTYWRPAIEPHEQNFNYGHREHLVSAIRDIAERLLTCKPKSNVQVDTLLTGSPWFIFRRLRLHLFRKFPSLFQRKIRTALLDSELRENPSLWHEWALLFSGQFKSLDSEAQNALLEWVERGDDLKANIQFYQKHYNGKTPDLELQEEWQARWQLRRFELIRDDLSGDRKQRFEELRTKYTAIDQPDLLHTMSGCQEVPHTSPVSDEQLQTMTAFEIVQKIQSWVQTTPYEGHSEWGLRGALKTEAKRDPKKFLNDCEAIYQLSTDRLVSILSACFESGIEGFPLDWVQFLELIEKVTKERILPEAEKVDPDTGCNESGIDLVRNFETALKNQPSPIPFECRDQVWKLVLGFLHHPEPRADKKERNTGAFDLINETLNTARGVAVRCIFVYAIWVRRNAGAGNEENQASEILQALDDRLANDKALSIRAIFGEWFPWLLHYHREWAIGRIPQIFSSGSEQEKRAAWESVLVHTKASISLFEALRDFYRDEVHCLPKLLHAEDKDSGRNTPTKGLVHHLMAFYWFGSLKIEGDPLLGEFYQLGPVWLRAHSLEYIGRALSNTEGEVPSLVAERFVNLADWRITTLETQSESERQELEGLIAWVPSLKLDEEWLFQMTYSVLQLLGKWTNYHHHTLLEPLAAYAKKNPLLAVQCLERMIEMEKVYALWGEEEEIKTILRSARDSCNNAAIRLHERVQDTLLRKNQLQFMSLEADPKKSS